MKAVINSSFIQIEITSNKPNKKISIFHTATT